VLKELLDDVAIDQIGRALGRAEDVVRVILYDWRVSRDGETELDVLVVYSNDPVKADAIRTLRSALVGDMSVNIAVMGEEHFEETKDVIGGLAYPADKHGTEIYP